MASKTLTCPYCNGQYQASPATDPEVCPRCGEPLPGQRAAGNRTRSAPKQRSNRLVVGILALVMTVMAVIGLVFAWWTIAERRSRDPKNATPVEVTAPADLKLLGFVPGDADVLIGVHVAELLEQPVGRELLTRLRVPPGNVGLDFIEQWTGIPLTEIDHMVIALNTNFGNLPRTSILLQTRLRVDTRKVSNTLKVSGSKSVGNKSCQQFLMPTLGLDSGLWFPEGNHTVVLNGPWQSLEQFPDVPNPGVGHLLPSHNKFLRGRTKGTQVWLTGDIADWESTALGLAVKLGVVPDAVGKTIMNMRTFGFAVELGESLQVSADIQGRNAKDTQAMATAVSAFWTAAALFSNRAETKALSQEFTKNLQTKLDGTNFTLQTKATAESVKRAFAAEPVPEKPEKK